jgi:hypothetical protein
MKIDPKQKGHLPKVENPALFVSPDGRFHGWKVKIPGHHSLATPAVVDGRVFVGGFWQLRLLRFRRSRRPPRMAIPDLR